MCNADITQPLLIKSVVAQSNTSAVLLQLSYKFFTDHSKSVKSKYTSISYVHSTEAFPSFQSCHGCFKLIFIALKMHRSVYINFDPIFF